MRGGERDKLDRGVCDVRPKMESLGADVAHFALRAAGGRVAAVPRVRGVHACLPRGEAQRFAAAGSSSRLIRTVHLTPLQPGFDSKPGFLVFTAIESTMMHHQELMT